MAWHSGKPADTDLLSQYVQHIRENFAELEPLQPHVAALLSSRIVEMGSNSNGTYVRWENGLQVCWNAINAGPANVFGSGTLDDMYRSETLHPSFPAQFQTPPYVVPFAHRPGSTGTGRPVGASYTSVSTSTVDSLQAWSFSNNSSDVILGYLAI